MLNYRKIDYTKDVPEIVELLKTSLSENHSVQNFLWKHYRNPFGKSYGRLACDGEKIVGVRMFMFWKFKKNATVVTAIRPVDTITHTDYRGKGIFKKLTIEGLKRCKGEYDFVFNTPNKNSFPGYIKMGWEEFEKKLQLKVAFVLPSIYKKISCKFIAVNNINLGTMRINRNNFHTCLTKDFVDWRYEDKKYKAAVFQIKNKSLAVIYKVEKIKGIKTLIVVELLGDKQYHSSAIQKLVWELKIFVVYFLDNQVSDLKSIFSKERQQIKVVYREEDFKRINELVFSAGDLEGIL